MKPGELLDLLRAVHGEKALLKRRHEEGARRVHRYDVNNTYQYLVARECMHLRWLSDAMCELEGERAPEGPAAAQVPKVPANEFDVLRADLDAMRTFIERWKGPIDSVSHARHRLMLRLVLGEMLEQQRFFEQALEGRLDLLGRRTTAGLASGAVIGTRWIS